MRRLLISLTTLATLALSGVAAGAAATPTMSLRSEHVNGSVRAVLSDDHWQVTGVLSSFQAHQTVSVHVFENGRPIARRRVALARHGSTGVFHLALHIGGTGKITVHAIHYASRAMPRVTSNFVSVWVVAPQAALGERTLSVRILQARLRALHYVIGAPGVLDSQTSLGVVAFQKEVGLQITGVPDASTFAALAAGKGVFPIRYRAHGRHVEADLTHQVLALIGAGDQVQRIYDMSSGKPSTPTAPGSFTVYNRTPGTNDLGMVDSSYFNGGDAIHGYAEVPPYAASHGCLRVPIPDAQAIYDWVQMGTPVDVYFG